MKKISNKLIFISVVLSFIFGLSFVSLAYADDGYVTSGVIFTPYFNNPSPIQQADNPAPTIESISPNSINGSGSNTTITITGEGFVSNSIAKENNSNLGTTFIDSNHLLTYINARNTYNTNGFYISVFNPAPGGGSSNAAYFTINNGTSSIVNTRTTSNNTSSTSVNNSNTSSTTNTTQTNATNDTNPTYGSLTSNALFGSNTFLPSGLFQWILCIIIILAIIVLWRYIHRSEDKYMSEPMKHA
jgi:hypothetical protein